MSQVEANETPNVKEVHGPAIYITVPIPLEVAKKLTSPPCRPSILDGSAHLSIVVDDLSSLKTYLFKGIYASTGMGGWMCKSCLLVDADINGETIRGYQILRLDFHPGRFGIAGFIKKIGAIVTQKVSSFTTVITAQVEPDNVEAEVCNILKIKGSKDPGPFDLDFASYVVGRPNKFLKQNFRTAKQDAGSIAWSKWGEGWSSTMEGIYGIQLDELSIDPLLKFILAEDFKLVDKSLIKAFVQREYILVDLVNTILS